MQVNCPKKENDLEHKEQNWICHNTSFLMHYTTPNQEATGMDTGWEKKDLILQWSDIGYSSQAHCSGIANQYGINSMFFCVVFVVMVVVWWICLFCSFFPVFGFWRLLQEKRHEVKCERRWGWSRRTWERRKSIIKIHWTKKFKAMQNKALYT